ncbi:polyprenyl synthetase family protein [bacterium]|nr:polyprenyl synthetase family protein [bacterium]MBU1650661.1 polyprenyl synthetase family protein [bacterium]
MNAAPIVEPGSLYEPINYFLGIGGKRLRPILMLLSAQAAGGVNEDALDAAVAIELLHNFTLVHDDIMDHDHLRRGHATVHVKWDESVAILAGDGLIGLAYRLLMKVPNQHLTCVCRIFTEGVIEVCEGQALDKEFEERVDVSLSDYFSMIAKKTGRLITMATEIGAILGGGTEEEVKTLREYGSIIGTAFQIQDDLLDIMASEEVIGKTFGSDVMAGKKTYMMVKALELPDLTNRRRVFEILRAPQVTVEMLLEMRSIFTASDILKQTSAEIQNYFDRANQILTSFPYPERTEGLRSFSEMLLNRKF